MGPTVKATWPAVTTEQHEWRTAAGQPAQGIIETAITAPIADRDLPSLRGDIGDHLSHAAAALDQLHTTIAAMPDHRRAAAISAVSSLEASASSAIEGITTTSRALNYAKLINRPEPVACNVRAIQIAMATHPSHQDALTAIHRTLLKHTQPVNAGLWRRQQAWLGPVGSTPDSAAYVPPTQRRIPAAMEDLLDFAESSHGSPVAAAALMYAQLVAIHPYADGNGRAGRAMLGHLLSWWRSSSTGAATDQVPAPIGIGLLQAGDEHRVGLLAYRKGDPVTIIKLVADALIEGAARACAFIEALDDLQVMLYEQVRDGYTTRSDSSVWPLIDYLLGQPVFTTGRAGKAIGVSRISGYNTTLRLVDAGLICPYDTPSPIPIWQVPQILDVWEMHLPLQ